MSESTPPSAKDIEEAIKDLKSAEALASWSARSKLSVGNVRPSNGRGWSGIGVTMLRVDLLLDVDAALLHSSRPRMVLDDIANAVALANDLIDKHLRELGEARLQEARCRLAALASGLCYKPNSEK